tara:strand:+ start:230 stop:427 length:198 start_codon:yes stop_codon:yes gene_type:complete
LVVGWVEIPLLKLTVSRLYTEAVEAVLPPMIQLTMVVRVLVHFMEEPVGAVLLDSPGVLMQVLEA